MFMEWRVNITKMSLLPKAIYRFNAIPLKYRRRISQTENKHPQTLYETKKRSQTASASFRKRNKVRSITQPCFLTTLPRPLWPQQPGTGSRTGPSIQEQNREPKISPHLYGQLILDKGGKSTMEWKQLFQSAVSTIKIKPKKFFYSKGQINCSNYK